MRARCANCQHVFSIEGEGAQTCPNCGAALHLDLPTTLATAPTTASSSDGSEPSDFEADSRFSESTGDVGGASESEPAPDQDKVPTPWERRAELGFFKGLFDTIAMSAKAPVAFFSSMPTSDAKGALTYYWIVGGASSVAATLMGRLFSILTGADAANREQLSQLATMIEEMDEAAQPFFEVMYGLLESTTTSSMALVCSIIGALFLLPINFLLYAGFFHLCAMVLGAARNGFDATMRACGYSATPLLLFFLPGCGMFFGTVGWFAFLIVGLARLQQVSYGRAAIAVLLPLLLCCACVCFGMMGIGVIGALGAAAEG